MAASRSAAEAAAADQSLRDAMTGYQRGDRDAFERLHARVSHIVRAYLLSLARDPFLLDDLVQETFLQVHRARHTYNASYPVTPWVLAIARHVFLMDRRHRHRRHEFARQPLDETSTGFLESHEDRVVATFALRHALAALGATTREAIVLHHVYGLSFEEIASRLEVGNPALRCRTSRGLARMRETLQANGRRRGGSSTRQGPR